MAAQLDLFGAAPAPAPAAPATCEHHGPEYVCERCPEGYDTDHSGFVHRLECRGRLALRKCSRCGELRTPGAWNLADWHSCLACVPYGGEDAQSLSVLIAGARKGVRRA